MLNRRQTIAGVLASSLSTFGKAARAQSSLFERLWANHPLVVNATDEQHYPCATMRNRKCTYNGSAIEDQCAVRMGLAFFKTFGKDTLERIPKIQRETDEEGKPRTCRALKNNNVSCQWHSPELCHFINAYEVHLALTKISEDPARIGNFFTGIGKTTRLSTRSEMKNFRGQLGNQNGIIYIHQYWGRGNPEAGGGHIDLWRGRERMTKLELFKGSSDSRFETRAESIRFWPIS